METLPPEVLLKIIAPLSDEKIGIFKENKTIRCIIDKVFTIRLFWKARVECLLDIVSKDFPNANWKYICHELLVNRDLMRYVYGNQPIIVEILLQNPRISFDSNFAIEFASERGYHEIVQLFLSRPEINAVIRNNQYILNHATKINIDSIFNRQNCNEQG